MKYLLILFMLLIPQMVYAYDTSSFLTSDTSFVTSDTCMFINFNKPKYEDLKITEICKFYGDNKDTPCGILYPDGRFEGDCIKTIKALIVVIYQMLEEENYLYKQTDYLLEKLEGGKK